MKLNKLGNILLIILALMLLINVVSAGDNTLVGTENGKLMMDSDSYALADDSDNGDVKLSAADSQQSLKAGETGNYTELQDLIDSNPRSIITLDKDYAYSGSDDIAKIIVSSSITINGNGHKISGENKAMSLYIPNDVYKVTLNNITFVNGKSDSMLKIDGYYCHVNDCTFEGNKATYGGAVYIGGSKNTLNNCQFTNNYANAYGGAIDIVGSYNSIYNSTFIGNSKPYSGGAVCLDGIKNLIYNCTFKDNEALYFAGAIDIYGKSNTIDNCTFEDNTASYYGGAVYMESTDCIVNNSVFNHNTVDYYGGAVTVYKDNNVIDNSDFSENIVNYGSGAAVYVTGNNVKVSDSTFEKHNGDTGGALYWIGSNGTVKGSKFNKNTAKSYGGAIQWESVGGTIEDCEFTENSVVRYNGGAIYVTQPNVVIKKSKFSENTAGKDAGAVYINTNNVTVKDSEFYKNHANDKAGAVEIYGRNNIIDNSVFESNDAVGDAGAVIIGYYYPDPEGSLNNTIRSSKFTNNKANGYGGAIRVDAQGNTIDKSEFYYNSANIGGGVSFNSKNNTIDNSRFEYNSAASEGGAVNLNTENLVINNTDLNYNNATNGGAVYVGYYAKNAIVNNSEFVMNDAFANGGAICWDSAYGTVDNSLFYNNIVDAGQNKAYGGAIQFTYGNVKISNSNFTWNMIYNRYGSAEGGALSIWGKDSTVENCKFEYNYAESYAGAIDWKGTDGTIFNSEFTNNTASTQGGAINGNGANLVINKSAFTNNSAFYLGGAIGLSVHATIDSSNFTLNHANKGGAVFWDAPTGLVKNSYFYKNDAYYAGGAIASDYMYDNGEKIIQNSLFEENTATNYGGAIASLHTQIIGSTFKNNDAHTGEALYSYLTSISPDSTFINNDVVIKPTELIKITPGDSIGNSTRKTNTTYLAMCVERYTSFPNVGIKDDSLERLVNVISGEPIADYLKILVYTFFNSKEDVYPHEDDNIYFYPEVYRDYSGRWDNLVKIPRPDYFSRAVHEFSDHDFWNSDHPVVLKVLELYKTVYANGTKMPEKFIKEVNGTIIEYDFSSMISPTSQSLFLFDIINYKLDVDKNSLNTTDAVHVNDTVAFNITVNNTADKPIINVTIDEIFNSNELEYIGHSNNKTWIKNGNTFTYTQVPDMGDIVVYTINLSNTGNCLVKNVKFNINYNSTQLEYVKSVGGTTVSNGANVIVYEFIPVEDSLTLEVWFKVLRNETLSDVDFDVVDFVAIDGSPLLPFGEVKNPKVSIQYDKVGRFPSIPVGENTAFTIWFKALTNGTLVNNITFKAQGFKDIVTGNYTNVYKRIAINVTKIWNDNNNQDGIRPENVTVVLMDDNGAVGEVVLNEGNNWKGNFSNLPVVYVNNGALINYTVVEKTVPAGYKNVTVKVDGYNYVINNTHVPEVTSVNVTKVWIDADNQDGIRPVGIVVVLSNDAGVVAEYELNADNGWKHTFTDLPVYVNEGTLINYTVAEKAVPAGYSGVTVEVDGYNYVINNTHVPEVTEVNVTKVWNDNDNQDGIRPVGIVVVLSNDTGVVAEYELNDANGWKHTFTDLPVYVNEGTLINYTVAEKAVPAGYSGVTVEVDGYNYVINNTHVPEVTEVNVTKNWIDADNQDGIRPVGIVVVLSNDTGVVAEYELNDANGWKHTFTDLPVYVNEGTLINYTVAEKAVPAGYSGVTVEVDGYNYVINNTHVPEVTEVSVVKVWNDKDNQDGVRPDHIVVELLADGVAVDSAVLNASNGWSFTFAALDVYKHNGTVIVYTVNESSVPAGYSVDIDSDNRGNWTVTNTHVPEVTSVNVTKNWIDADNQDGIRPVGIVVVLSNDTGVVAEYELNDANGWKHTFTDLPVYVNEGTLINYTVAEKAVPAGYAGVTVAVDGYNYVINNTHVPEVTEVSVVKVWNDNNNQDGVMPENIVIELLADGVAVNSAVLNASNGWSFTFAALDVYKNNGTAIVYTVNESSVPAGYSVAIDSDGRGNWTVTNTHVPAVTDVSVVKVWNDNNNQDGVRPVNVTVVLVADGNVIDTAVLDASNDWSASFTDLPVYNAGEVIKYSVEEVSIADYVSVVSNDTAYDWTVVNTHVPAVTNVSVVKVWNDNNNQDGVRPVNVTVVLMGNGNVVGSAVLDASNGWSASFTDLPVYNAGEVIEYSVEEVSVADYVSAILVNAAYNFTVVNTHVPEVTVVNVAKVWNDNNNQDDVRPVDVTVVLVADGDIVGTAVLNDFNSWRASFENLPVYNAGNVIKYSVEEVSVSNYTVVVSNDAAYDWTVVNTHVPAVTNVSVVKVWNDNNNQDGVRPVNVTVVLMGNGNVVGSAVLDASNGWSASFTDLPVYANGNVIVYSVEEVSVADYVSAILVNAAYDFTVVNTHVPAVTDVSVVKVWNDNNNQDGVRPVNVTVVLMGNGNVVGSAVLDASNGWSASFTDLPVYANGNVIVYSVEEVSVADYTGVVSNDTAYDWTVVNTHVPAVTDVSVVKVWNDNNNQDGVRPVNVTVVLMGNGNVVGSAVLDASNGWSASFTDLPVYNDGNVIEYSVEEVSVADYSSAISVVGEYAFSVVNTHVPAVTNVSVVKVWDDNNDQDGVRPVNVTVVLLGNGDVVGSAVLDASNGWSASFTDLPVYNDGNVIEYSVEEVSVADYISAILVNAAYNFTVVNTHVPAVTNVSVVKVWNDNDNQDGVRPVNVTVVLVADGDVVGSAVLDASNDWSVSFTDLPVYNAGEVIVYSVEEVGVADYTGVVSNDTAYDWTVVNTHVPAVTDVSVVKVWDDNNDQDGARPVNVTVVLVADGDVVGSAVLDASNSWSASFTDLPVYDNGNMIEYSVEELSVSNYTTAISVDGENSFTVVNTHVPAVTDISVVKVWNDANNNDGVRPSSVTVVLIADGNVVDTAVLDVSNDWSISFADLPVYNDGNVIEYSVEELSVANYTAEISVDAAYDFTVVNTHVPVVTAVNVTKVWNDANNEDGVRPANITVILVADGNVVGSAVLDASNDWSISFADLPVYNDGNVIEYSVEEVRVANYTTAISVDGENTFTIVNTHIPVITVVNITKVWRDIEEKEKITTPEVEIEIYSQGVPVANATLFPGDDENLTFEDIPVYQDVPDNNYTIPENNDTVNETDDEGNFTIIDSPDNNETENSTDIPDVVDEYVPDEPEVPVNPETPVPHKHVPKHIKHETLATGNPILLLLLALFIPLIRRKQN